MIKNNKDLIFIICVIAWLASNIASSLVWGGAGIAMSNFINIALIGTMVLVQYKNAKFAAWLDKPFNNPSKIALKILVLFNLAAIDAAAILAICEYVFPKCNSLGGSLLFGFVVLPMMLFILYCAGKIPELTREWEKSK